MVDSSISRRRFLKLGVSGAVVVVIAGVGSYLMLQAPPAPTPPAPAAPAATPKPAPAVPVTPSPIPAPAATSSPIPSPAVTPTPSPTLVDKANKEGSVMAYSSWDTETMQGIKVGFEKKYPNIKMDFIIGYQFVQRLSTEHAAGKYILDTYVGSVSDLLEGPLEEGLVDKYISPEAAVFPPHLKDPEGYWIVPQMAPQAIVYNTNLVKGEDIPKSFWDLLKPRFKNKLGIYGAPQSPHAALISKRKIIGPDRWMEFLRALKAQNVKDFTAHGAIFTLLKTGEIEAALWAYTGTATTEINKGAPIEYVRRTGTLVGGGSVLWIYKRAPHPNAARLLYDYMISAAGQSLINDMGKYVELRPGIPPKMGVGVGIGQPVKPEDVAYAWPWTKKDALDIVAEWKSVFTTT